MWSNVTAIHTDNCVIVISAACISDILYKCNTNSMHYVSLALFTSGLPQALNTNSLKFQLVWLPRAPVIARCHNELTKKGNMTIYTFKKPLTNGRWKLFAMAVVRTIMDFSGAECALQTVSSGSEWSVSYSLLQGSHVIHYTGPPISLWERTAVWEQHSSLLVSEKRNLTRKISCRKECLWI